MKKNPIEIKKSIQSKHFDIEDNSRRLKLLRIKLYKINETKCLEFNVTDFLTKEIIIPLFEPIDKTKGMALGYDILVVDIKNAVLNWFNYKINQLVEQIDNDKKVLLELINSLPLCEQTEDIKAIEYNIFA